MPTQLGRARRLLTRALAAAIATLTLTSGLDVASPQPASAGVGYWTDLTVEGLFHNMSQVDPRWGPIPMGSDEWRIGRCGCQISAFSAVIGQYMGAPALDPLPGTGLSSPLFASTIVKWSILTEIGSWRRRWILETDRAPAFSPAYVDEYLRYGVPGHGMPYGWGYEEGAGCGAPPTPYALEWIAEPNRIASPSGGIPLGPRGIGANYLSGFQTDIVDKNLRNGRPTMIGRHIPNDDGSVRKHMNLIVGYDPITDRYRVVDPVSPTGAYGSQVYGDDAKANEQYADFVSSIVTTIDVYPVNEPLQHFVITPEAPPSPSPLAAASAGSLDDGRASIELGAVLQDGTRVGYDPATGEHVQFHGHFDYAEYPIDPELDIRTVRPYQGLVTTDVEPGTLRTRIVGTSDGTYSVRLHDVRDGGLVDDDLAVVTGTIAQGEEVKHEVAYADDGSAVAVRVDDFTPEVVVAPISGVAGDPVDLVAGDSFDADDGIASIAWDFGDGSTGTGATPAHTWTKPGTYEVEVTVTSTDGATSTETVIAEIAPTETDGPDLSLTTDPDVGDGTWTRADEVTVNAAATDTGSGVESITMSASGADTNDDVTTSGDTAQLVVDAEGRTTVTALATDRMDNVTGGAVAQVNIDRTAPSASVRAASQPLRSMAFLAGAANDSLSGIDRVEVRVQRADGKQWDGAAWVDDDAWLSASGKSSWWVTSGLPAGADLPDGTYAVSARAVDEAGNVGAPSAAASLEIAAGTVSTGLPVTELAPTATGPDSTATGVTDAGDPVGHTTGYNLNYGSAQRWSAAGASTTLLPLTGRTGAAAEGVSGDGDTVVGWSTSSIGQRRATAWVNGQPIDLGVVVGGISEAHDATDGGLVVGSSSADTQQRSRAARFVNGFAGFLPDLGGGSSVALAVNDAGVAVGYSAKPGSTATHAFKTDGSTAVELGTPSATSIAYDINDAGQAVGDDDGDAVRWDGTTRVLLAPDATARGIAGDGTAVGDRFDPQTGTSTALLWRNGQTIVLDDLIDPASGWHLERAEKISEDGRIVVGVGTLLGRQRGFRIDLTASGGGGGGGGGGDTTAPVTTATIDPVAAASEWVNTPVEVVLNADDGAGSGVASIAVAGYDDVAGASRAVTLDADGEHQLAWAAIDEAGNVETPPGTATVRIDRTAPTATVTPAAGTDGWATGPVAVAVDGADDGGSGLSALRVSVDGGAPSTGGPRTVTVTGDGEHSVTVVPVDGAGNEGDAVTTTVRIDATGPTLLMTPDDGAVVEPAALVSYESADEVSGVDTVRAWVTDARGRREIANGESLTRRGAVTIEVRATDEAGNVTTEIRSVVVGGDDEPGEPPAANQLPLADAGGPYEAGVDQVFTIDGTASSDPDGDALTYTWYLDYTLLDTGPTVQLALLEPGSHVLTLVVNDGTDSSLAAGAAVTTVTITPRGYAFEGFERPVDNDGVVNVVQSGRTIPMKWRLTDGDGPVDDPTSVASTTSRRVSCTAGAVTDTIEETTTSKSGLTYQGDGRWHYNWATAKSWAGTCRVFTLTLDDGSTYSATFRFR